VRIEEMKSAYKSLVGKSGRKRLLQIFERRWENNSKLDLKEMGVIGRRLN